MKIALIVLLTLNLLGFINYYYQTHRKYAGDDPAYNPDSVTLKDSILKDKTIIFLGSSVTYGRNDVSFVEYLRKQTGLNAIKEAISGTTLVDKNVRGKKSYVCRLNKLDKTIKADLLVCQLSTNDALIRNPLGKISNSFELNDFDTQTISGAIEYIIAYSKNTFNCPVMFYTGTRYNSKYYGRMVELLKEIAKKWDIEIIDLWNELDVDLVSKEMYKLYMINGIHPSLCGYRDWWTPFIQNKLETYFKRI